MARDATFSRPPTTHSNAMRSTRPRRNATKIALNTRRSRGPLARSILLTRPPPPHRHTHHGETPFPLRLRNRVHTRAAPPMPVRYLHGTPRTDLTHSAVVHTPTRLCATRRILPPRRPLSLARPPSLPPAVRSRRPVLSTHALGRSVGHERERFASLRSSYTGCYVTSLPEYPA